MKTNITRDIDRQYGYDLEIENSFTRADGYTSCAYLNGELIDTFYGVSAESDAKARLYSEVTHQINGGAQPVAVCSYCGALSNDDCGCYVTYPSSSDIQFHHQTVSSIRDRIIGEDIQSAPATYAELVEARESAYIAQRDAENKLNDIKAALTASIASDPAYKNDAARKAELANRLQDYDTYVDQATKTADAYRKACNAIEVYQEQAKDARARLRYETAQLELRAAELQLQVAQAKHDAQDSTDEDAYGESLAPTVHRQFVEWDAADVELHPGHKDEKPIGYIAIVNDDDGNYEFREGSMTDPYRVYKHQADAYEVAKTLISDYEYQRPSTQPIYLEMPF